MTALGVIPARYNSSRFPGKALPPLCGRPMIEWVWRGARAAKTLARVVVATDDERIADVCRAFGAEVALTRDDHRTGTDRTAEVAVATDHEIVVNIQGDEPLIEGFAIDAAVDALREAPDAAMSTVVHAVTDTEVADPHRVKVALDTSGNALYFSRSVIPAVRSGGVPPRYWQHVGLYAYRRAFLLELAELPPTPAERAEGLEQLRALEHGCRIRCAVLEGYRSVPVDIPADVARAEARLRESGRC